MAVFTEYRIKESNMTINVTQSSMPPFDEYASLIRPLWETRRIANRGALHEELTERLKEYLNVPEFLLFVNGHLALELGLQALDLCGEVITSPFTFISTTHAIVRNGLTPVFCDIDAKRLTIDPEKIEGLITENTSAIVAVHVYGIPCDVAAIEGVAAKHRLKVIYDAAHSFGSRHLGKNIAEYGDYSIFSFHATKVFHTIEGGGAAFNDVGLTEKLRHLRDFGLCPGGEEADEIGLNAKLSEFHAAMGLCNLNNLTNVIAKRKAVTHIYDGLLDGIPGLRLFPNITGLKRNYAYYPIIIEDIFGLTRNEAAEKLTRAGINARKYFYPLTNAFVCYKQFNFPRNTPIAADIANRVLCLPLYADMTEDDVKKICAVFTGKR